MVLHSMLSFLMFSIGVLLLFHMYLLKLDCFSPERKVDARKERERDTLCLRAVTIPLMGTRCHRLVMFTRPLTNRNCFCTLLYWSS